MNLILNGIVLSVRVLATLAMVLITFVSMAPSIPAEIATVSLPVRVSVQIPQTARNSRVVMLEVSVRGVRKSDTDHIGAVVTLSRVDGNSVEIGRFSIQSSSFKAANPDEEQRFQFNVTDLVKQLDLAGRSADIEVTLIDRANGNTPVAAELIIGNVEIQMR